MRCFRILQSACNTITGCSEWKTLRHIHVHHNLVRQIQPTEDLPLLHLLSIGVGLLNPRFFFSGVIHLDGRRIYLIPCYEPHSIQ